MNSSLFEIRLVAEQDASALSHYFTENAEHFRLWQPTREPGFHGEFAWQTRVAEYAEQHRLGSAAHFIAVDNGQVIAHCSLTNIIYGAFCACYMGYGVAQRFQGQGVMAVVCQHAIAYAFEQLKLNRIMANYMPSNIRSGRLLNRLGFVEEGLAKRYLKINGAWEDHVLTALVNSHPK